MFYLLTKGKRHTVFLREAYEKGRLLDPTQVYEARRMLLDLVVLGRRGVCSLQPSLARRRKLEAVYRAYSRREVDRHREPLIWVSNLSTSRMSGNTFCRLQKLYVE
ncbi:hypothetical protein RJ639_042283 [Escallonia herrerae]|uniref:PORR domain-containing protein n=1 Tax=Escallonia herrerae TaxID=1293975 RepID=A0AA88WIA3_9ASTE|nr:hypothetical protein RJ639_042283 [Escallonia herrerae]